MKRRALAIVTAALVLGLMPGSAIAGGGEDQGAAAHDLKIGGPKTYAQTVTVGVTGQLTGVDLYLFETYPAKMTASIRLVDRVTRLPIGSAKASATVTVADVGWYHFEFATPVSFIAGGRFAIVFSVTAWGVAYASLGSYPNGQALEEGSAWGTLPGKPNLAFAFATWVTPTPNPTAQPIPTPTPAPKATPKSVASKTPAATQTSAGPSPSAAVASPSHAVASPSTSASASANPTSSGSDPEGKTGDSGSSGGSPILITAAVIAALALVAIVGAGGFALGRRRK
jgi:hypothetical protein